MTRNSRLFDNDELRVAAVDRVRQAHHMRMEAAKLEASAVEEEDVPPWGYNEVDSAGNATVYPRSVPSLPADKFLTHDSQGKEIAEEYRHFYPRHTPGKSEISAWERWWDNLDKRFRAIIVLTPLLCTDRIASAMTDGRVGSFETIWRFIVSLGIGG